MSHGPCTCQSLVSLKPTRIKWDNVCEDLNWTKCMVHQRCPEKDRGEGPYTQLLRLSACLSFLSRNTIFSASPGTQFLPSCSMACFSPKGPLWLTTPCSSLLSVHLGGDGDVYNNLSANSEVLSKMRTWHSVPPRRSVPEAEAGFCWQRLHCRIM